MPQPPYSPDLAPCDFFLFQKVKSAVKGHHFESREDNQRAVTQALNDIPQTSTNLPFQLHGRCIIILRSRKGMAERNCLSTFKEFSDAKC
jgi:hypothetical protein